MNSHTVIRGQDGLQLTRVNVKVNDEYFMCKNYKNESGLR
ncbi:hypothetical protein SAMN04488072_11967 [Lentibacillus halodurans]|uniref:Uncharacterized protein n=1 Tax=Lentibacillus halodurans TaxID=237679 RepID=A0A1I1AJC5_9BACI|nr:hypothetical protein SAMN04488072_11967 [Lentibacillus halodurans]